MAGQQGSGQDRLTRDFFARPVLEVAPELLGCRVSHAGVTVRLTEVEAYDGSNDPGSHAFRGPTPRTQVMFGEPGGLYVYFTYGMHWCANLVCGPVGTASAVLLRAGEVVGGLDEARERRASASRTTRATSATHASPQARATSAARASRRAGATRGVGVVDRDLARGPARLAMALGLGRDQNGIDTLATDSPVMVRSAEPAGPGRRTGTPVGTIRTGPRVGLTGPGGDLTTYPWRFWLEGEATVSAYRPGTVRRSKPPASPGER